MESIWEKTCKGPARPPLYGKAQADVAVIGGGMTGILTALELQERGLQVVVAEAGHVGGGQTGRTVAGRFAVKSIDYFWHDSCNASKRFHIWECIMLELLFVIGFFVMLMVTGVSLLGIIAALVVATAIMFLGGMLALMIKLLPWLLLAIAVVWVIKAIKAPKVPKYQRYDRWRY